MTDDYFTRVSASPRRSKSGGLIWGGAIAFILGAGVVGWLAERSGADFTRLFHKNAQTAAPAAASQPPAAETAPASETVVTGTLLPNPTPSAADAANSARIAALEQRLDQLTLRSEAASGNANRAEALMIALATRRSVERGASLGYLGDQLKLRFADAQPHAVEAILTYAKDPVTLDQLSARLNAMASQISSGASTDTGWQRLRREISSLLIIRRENTSSTSPDIRFEHARMCLQTGQITESIAYVRALPGASDAKDWIGDATRYADAMRALDLLETTAIFDSHRLNAADGKKIEQPSPAALPANSY